MATSRFYHQQIDDGFAYQYELLNKADIDGNLTIGGVWFQDQVLTDRFSGYKQVWTAFSNHTIEWGNPDVTTHTFIATGINSLKVKVGSSVGRIWTEFNLTDNSQLGNGAGYLQANDLDGFLYDVQYNSTAHTLTFFQQNEPDIVIDLPIESLIKGVALVGNDLVFTFEDNTTASVPLNTLLVGVVKEVNGKTPNSAGQIVLNVTDIPNLSSELANKLDIRMANLVSNLSQAEKNDIYAKLGIVNNIVQVLGISGHTITLSNGGGSVVVPFTDWSNIPNKPTSYPPSAHLHNIADVNNLQGALNAKQDVLTAGANIQISPTNVISATDTIYTHPNSGVTAGTYNNVTVNAQGHVTNGTNEPYITASSLNTFTVGLGLAILKVGQNVEYSIAQPTMDKINHGETAYTWGNHANAGYTTLGAVQTWVNSQGYATTTQLGNYVLKSGDTMSGRLNLPNSKYYMSGNGNERHYILQPNINKYGDFGIYSNNASQTGAVRYDLTISDIGWLGVNGVLEAQAPLHVNGNAIVDNATANNHAVNLGQVSTLLGNKANIDGSNITNIGNWQSQLGISSQVLNPTLQSVTNNGNSTTNSIIVGGVVYSGSNIGSPNDVAFYHNSFSYGQRILTRGLLASDDYSDNTLIPANGIYSKGTITTSLHGTSSDWKDIMTKFLGTNTANIASGSTIQSLRREDTSEGNYAYSPILHLGASDTAWQLQADYSADRIQFRGGYNGTYRNWVDIVHANNITSYVNNIIGGNYVLKSGDTMQGDLGLANNVKFKLKDPLDPTHYIWNNPITDYDEVNFSTCFNLKHYSSGDIAMFTDSVISLFRNVIVPNATANNHAVNLGQLNNAIANIPTPNNGSFVVQGVGALTGAGTTSANASANTTATLDLTTATKNEIAQGVNAYNFVTNNTFQLNNGFDYIPTGGSQTIQPTATRTIIAIQGANVTITLQDGLYDGDECSITTCGGQQYYVDGSIVDDCSNSIHEAQTNTLWWWHKKDNVWRQAI